MDIRSPALNTFSDIDEGSPPLVAGFTSGLDKGQWLSALGHGNDSDEGDLQTDLIVKAGEIFARAAEEDPALLVNILAMGEAIVKTALMTQAQEQQQTAMNNSIPMAPMGAPPVPTQPMMVPPMPGGTPIAPNGMPPQYVAAGQSVPPPSPMGGPPMQPPGTPF